MRFLKEYCPPIAFLKHLLFLTLSLSHLDSSLYSRLISSFKARPAFIQLNVILQLNVSLFFQTRNFDLIDLKLNTIFIVSPFNVELLIRDNLLNLKSFIKIFNFQNKKQNSIYKVDDSFFIDLNFTQLKIFTTTRLKRSRLITLVGIDGMFVETSPKFEEDAFALFAMAMSYKPNVGFILC